MMKLKLNRLFAVVILGLGTALASPIAMAQQTLLGHVPNVVTSPGLKPVGLLDRTNQLRLTISLPLRNRAALATLLRQFYDPASTNYHRFLTPRQFAETFGPAREDYEALIAFARSNGLEVTGTHPNRTLLDVRAVVPTIENALHVRIQRFQHPTEKRTFFAPDGEPVLDLAVPVLHISGLDDFIRPRPFYKMKAQSAGVMGTPHSAASPAGTGSAPGGGFIGSDFRAAYIPGTALTGHGQTVALVEFETGFYPSDIASYEAAAGLPNVPIEPVLVDGYSGAVGGLNENAEVSLDIETAIAMAPGLDQVLVYEGSSPDDILNAIATDNIANQISASWGYGVDAGTEQIYQQFAAQGQSFFNASGDGDAWVGAIPYGSCEDPNVTIVGGTTLTTAGPGGPWSSETVWNWGNTGAAGWNPDGYVGSSGGISTDMAIPAWQQGLDMSANGGSATMRNLPDVALTADNIYVTYYNGMTGLFGGTSCAAPLWASFTALINEQAAAGGKPPVGFLDPALYNLGQQPAYNSDFHDIVSGDNTWDQSLDYFFAVAGYDLCTGWGTPAGESLVSALAQPDDLRILPVTGFNVSMATGGPIPAILQALTVTNTGSDVMSWTVANPVPWLTVSEAGGTLPTSAFALVNVTLNADAASLPPAVYTGTVWFTNLTHSVAFGRQFTLAVLSPPSITLQPTNQTVVYGATAMFAVEADGTPPLSYQWQLGGTNVTDGSYFSGSTTNILTVSNVTPASVGSYTVAISNAALVVTSMVATLSIEPSPPVIYQQPSSQTVIAGSAVQFTVMAYGDPPFAYQWQLDGTNLPGCTGAWLLFTNVQPGQAGDYSVAITNMFGGTLSSSATLTVVTDGIVNVATFDDFNVPAGAYVELGNGYDNLNWNNFNVVNGLAPIVLPVGPPTTNSGYYAGVISADNVVFNPFGAPASISQPEPFNLVSAWFTAAWNDNLKLEAKGYVGGTLLYDSTCILSATTPTNVVFNFFGVTEVDFISSGGAPHPGYGAAGSQFVMDDMVVVESSGSAINTTPVIYAFGPANLMVSQGQDTSLSVAAAGTPPLTYQWQKDGLVLPGQTNALLHLANAQSDTAAAYSVVVTNLFGSTTSSVAAVTVVIAPLITVEPLDQVVIRGNNANFNVAAMGTAPLQYQWRFQGANIPGAAAASYTAPSVTEASAGGYDVVITNQSGSVTSRMASLTVVLSPGLIHSSDQPVVFFPSAATNYILQMTTDPASGKWVTVTNGNPWSGLAAGNLAAKAFFRLNIGAQTITQIAGGYTCSFFIKSDGSLWAMGNNGNGQLGDGSSGSFTGWPEQIVAGNVTAVSAGDTHSLFLKSDGSLWAMGNNSDGQLGDGTYNSAYVPREIVASNVMAVAAGSYHSLFLKRDGSLWAMGQNTFGQLGDGGVNDVSSPEQIVATNVTAIAAGQWHSLFLKRDGSLWAMGYNALGELGDGTGNLQTQPEQIVAGDVTAIAAGAFDSLFLKSDGSLWGTGDNYYGELGDGTWGNAYSPEQLVAGNVAAIGAGGFHTLFLKSDGSLWAVGSNQNPFNGNSGQLGNGSYDNTNRPQQIESAGVTSVAGGGFHSLFLTSDGSLWGMGMNREGELGVGTDINTNRPERIVTAPAVPKPSLALGAYGNEFVVLFPAVPAAPTNATGAISYSLSMTTNLVPANWQIVTNAIPFSGVEVTNAPCPAYFRLY